MCWSAVNKACAKVYIVFINRWSNGILERIMAPSFDEDI